VAPESERQTKEMRRRRIQLLNSARLLLVRGSSLLNSLVKAEACLLLFLKRRHLWFQLDSAYLVARAAKKERNPSPAVVVRAPFIAVKNANGHTRRQGTKRTAVLRGFSEKPPASSLGGDTRAHPPFPAPVSCYY
jgi:hypothetical protein